MGDCVGNPMHPWLRASIPHHFFRTPAPLSGNNSQDEGGCRRVPAWRRSWPAASGRRGPRAFRLLDDRPKCFRLTYRELGKDLAIDFDAGLG